LAPLHTRLPQLYYLANKITNCKHKLKVTLYIKTLTLDTNSYIVLSRYTHVI